MTVQLGRIQRLMQEVLSSAQIPHGGFIVYEAQGHEDHLHIGECVTRDMRFNGAARMVVPVFIAGIQEAAELFFHGQDPDWGRHGDMTARAVGLLVKHRASALRLPRARPLSQGAVAVFRDLTFHCAHTTGSKVKGWQHETDDPDSRCICVVFRDAARTMWPTCREPV
jgi:hypothetical protein